MSPTITIRPIRAHEVILLENFLYNAIFIPEGLEKPPRDIIHLPEIACYIKDFGRESDLCVVAETENQLIGAIWTRLFSGTNRGYGYIDSQTPELSMSVLEPYRNQGVGTRLLKAMLEKLRGEGYTQVSLSVDKLNYACKLYRKFGFETVKSDEASMIMLKKLGK